MNDLEDVKQVVPRALEVGGGEVHILVNCGGMLIREDSVDVKEDDWNTVCPVSLVWLPPPLSSQSASDHVAGFLHWRLMRIISSSPTLRSPPPPCVSLTPAQVLDVNLNSLFPLSKAAANHMIPKRRGKIINIASLNSFIGGFRVASYTASKAGVLGLTKALSNEWAKYNITVNAIAPGSVATDMYVFSVTRWTGRKGEGEGEADEGRNTEARKNPEFIQARLAGTPGGRWGTPEDFAGPALFLASAASQFVTGETIIVDGVSVPVL